MLKKLNIKTLLGLFIVLLAIVAITMIIDSRKGNRTFKKEVITINSQEVTKITIHPRAKNQKEVVLVRENATWKLMHEGKKISADEKVVDEILKQLSELKTERLAANSKDKWAEYEVTDTASTRVIIETNETVIADLIIGKFTYQQPDRANPYMQQQNIKMSTYVRLNNEVEVYSVNGFLNMTFNRDFSYFRNKSVVDEKFENWRKLTYTFPGDSSYTIIKNNDLWLINGIIADSLKTTNFIRAISPTISSEFVDNTNIAKSDFPVYSLKIEGDSMAPYEIKAFASDTINKYIVNSSLNPEATFADPNESIVKKLFIGKDVLLVKDTVK